MNTIRRGGLWTGAVAMLLAFGMAVPVGSLREASACFLRRLIFGFFRRPRGMLWNKCQAFGRK